MGRRRRIYLRLLKGPRRLFLYPRCAHLSHRVLWPCWREAVSDGYCPQHNNDCWGKH